jgi:hypothetical protein
MISLTRIKSVARFWSLASGAGHRSYCCLEHLILDAGYWMLDNAKQQVQIICLSSSIEYQASSNTIDHE